MNLKRLIRWRRGFQFGFESKFLMIIWGLFGQKKTCASDAHYLIWCYFFAYLKEYILQTVHYNLQISIGIMILTVLYFHRNNSKVLEAETDYLNSPQGSDISGGEGRWTFRIRVFVCMFEYGGFESTVHLKFQQFLF